MLDPRSENMIPILQRLANEGFEIIENIGSDSTKGLHTHDMYYAYLFDVIISEFDSLKSVEYLLEKGKLKDCFTLLRTNFEGLLFYWLMVHGRKYRFLKIYTVTVGKNKTQKESRDGTLKKWRKGKKDKLSPYEDIISMDPEGDNKIRTVYEYDGLYDEKDKKRTGYFIPFYFFVLTDHYNQFVKFNSELPSIKTGSSVSEKREKENLLNQSIIYSKYIHIDAIIRNLVLNNLVTRVQTDYIRVHYNFLSSFVHPTKEMFQFLQHPLGFSKTDVPNEIIVEQIWLYVCQFQYLLLKILLERIDNYNPKANTEKYKEIMLKLNHATSYFWFIDNKPTSFDQFVSNQNKRFAHKFGKKEPDELEMYYEDPIARLCSFKNWG